MNLTYAELLSSEPIILSNVGTIVKHHLSFLAHHYMEYQWYVGIMLMIPETYYSKLGMDEYYQNLTLEEKTELHIFDLFIEDKDIRPVVIDALNFFFLDAVTFDEENKLFCLFRGNTDDPEDRILSGVINRETWDYVKDIIRQINYLASENNDLAKAKGSKKALKLLSKMMEGRKKKQELSTLEDTHENELGNMISVVSARSQNLNIINIWDITLYQLWDLYSRLKINTISDMDNRGVSVWGNEKNRVNIFAWCKNIKHEFDVSK